MREQHAAAVGAVQKRLAQSDFEKFVLAQSITLTPGTVTVRIKDDEFLVHAISGEAADGFERLRWPNASGRLFAID